jgi:hypothetical protein
MHRIMYSWRGPVMPYQPGCDSSLLWLITSTYDRLVSWWNIELEALNRQSDTFLSIM